VGLYKCNNKDCKNYNKELNTTTHIKYKDFEATDSGAPCPECGKIRPMVNRGYCTNMYGSPNICTK